MSELLPELKRYLLTLLGGAPVPLLNQHDWSLLNAMAKQHRLQPLLAWQLENAGPAMQVPHAIQATWREARQAAGLTSLMQQAALRLAADELDKAGIGFVALKGPRLAWGCYPQASLRPMRDIDLLVAPGSVVTAARLLSTAGFHMNANEAMVAEALARDKHLPPLWHNELGVALELHHRLIDLPGSRGYRVPQLDSAVMLDNRELVYLANAVVPCPTPTQLLGHLMVHALYSHRLDCGPLILADIHYLLAAGGIDNNEFEKSARNGGWLRGAALLLALTERYFGKQPLLIGTGPPPAVLVAAEDAVLQDFEKREHGAALADLLSTRSPLAFAGAMAKRMRPRADVLQQEGARGLWTFWPFWVWRRLCRVGAHLADRRARGEANNVLAMLRWLQG